MIKRGTVCAGPLYIYTASLAANVTRTVRVDAYGDATLPKPIIQGSEEKTLHWSRVGALASRITGANIAHLSGNPNVYVTEPADLPSNYAFYDFIADGEMAMMSRYPDEATLVKVPITAKQVPATIPVAVPPATPVPDRITAAFPPLVTWGFDPNDGMSLAFLAHSWTGERIKIRSYNSATKEFALDDWIGKYDASNRTNPIIGFGSFIQNALYLISVPGEYFYDRTDNRLYYYSKTGAPPARSEFTTVNTDGLIRAFGYWEATEPRKLNLEVRNLILRNAVQNAVYDLWLNKATVDNVDVENVGGGFGLYYNNSSTLTNNTFKHTNNAAVSAMWTLAVTVKDNTLENVGRLGNLQSGFGLGQSGIWLGTIQDSIVVTGNTLSDIAGNGIIAGELPGTNLIAGNRIEKVLKEITDGGHIYYVNSYALDAAHGPSEISGNTLLDSYPYGDFQGIYGKCNEGVYLDFATSGIKVLNNTFDKIGSSSLLINGGDDNIVNGNTVTNHVPDSYWVPLFPRYINGWRPERNSFSSNVCRNNIGVLIPDCTR